MHEVAIERLCRTRESVRSVTNLEYRLALEALAQAIFIGDLRANHPSSSSRRVRAGSGAPGASPSTVGNLRFPSPAPNGFQLDRPPSSGFVVLAAGSRRDQPRLFILSLNDDEAMVV